MKTTSNITITTIQDNVRTQNVTYGTIEFAKDNIIIIEFSIDDNHIHVKSCKDYTTLTFKGETNYSVDLVENETKKLEIFDKDNNAHIFNGNIFVKTKKILAKKNLNSTTVFLSYDLVLNSHPIDMKFKINCEYDTIN